LLHRKNNFTEESKDLSIDIDLKIMLDQNNFVGILSMMNNAAKCCNILIINFVILFNYFDDPVNYFQIYI